MTIDIRTGEIVESLTEVESRDLRHAEHIIEAGLQTFVEVGKALAGIRDARLYRETHATFEDYCDERWGFTDRRARQMIDAAEVVAKFPTGTIVPTTESQARELRNLAPEPAAEVMRTAHEATEGKPTAKAIREARAMTSERLSAGYVDQFPALAFFRDRGEHERVNALGRDLAAMDATERSTRLEVLDKTIAYEKRKAQTSSPEPQVAEREGTTSDRVPTDPLRGSEAGAATPEVQSERVEPSPAPRPTVTGDLVNQMHHFLSAAAERSVTADDARRLADALHDYADALEAHDAQQ